jgi:hypothetical protein
MLAVDRVRSRVVRAPVGACRAVLADAAGHSEWAGVLESVEQDGDVLVVNARVLGLAVELRCVLDVTDSAVVLRRIPYDDADDESFVATWTLEEGRETTVTLHVKAALDAPRAASLLRGPIEHALTDDLLRDFANACERTQAPEPSQH